MPNAQPTPTMTTGRAALVSLLAHYSRLAMADPSLIEAQKLMYFLQTSGEDLRLDFVPHHYGPYSDRLRHVLTHVEGHYVSGFGDGSHPVRDAEPLTVLPGAEAAARPVLDEHPATAERIELVMALVEGFESAYALELLATVHWCSTSNVSATTQRTSSPQCASGIPERRGCSPASTSRWLPVPWKHGAGRRSSCRRSRCASPAALRETAHLWPDQADPLAYELARNSYACRHRLPILTP